MRKVHKRKDLEMVSKTIRAVRSGAQIRALKTGVPGDFPFQVLEEDLGSR